jgi:hypothetical protein
MRSSLLPRDVLTPQDTHVIRHEMFDPGQVAEDPTAVWHNHCINTV